LINTVIEPVSKPEEQEGPGKKFDGLQLRNSELFPVLCFNPAQVRRALGKRGGCRPPERKIRAELELKRIAVCGIVVEQRVGDEPHIDREEMDEKPKGPPQRPVLRDGGSRQNKHRVTAQ